MLKFVPLDLSEFSDIDHFRCKSPLPFPVKPLLVKPLPVSTSGGILPRIADTADLVFDSLLCMFDSFLRFNSPLRSSIYFFAHSIDIGAVGFISMRFALFVYSSIHFCEVRFMFVPVRFNFCAVRFTFWAVRFIFAWFDSFFAVLTFYDRFSFYLCAFHIVHFGV